jgi:hypothetical protein
MDMEADGELHRVAGVADALEAAVLRGVAAPAVHAAEVELPVARVEPPPVDARPEVAGHRHDRPLRLPLDLVAQQQEVRRRAERRVDHQALHRPPLVARDRELAAARVVQPSGEVDHR